MLDPRNSIEMAIRLILRVLNKDPSQHMSARTERVQTGRQEPHCCGLIYYVQQQLTTNTTAT
jgi:hypothetical protein